MQADEERNLICRSQAGEVAAFQHLANEHAARLWRCAFALCKDSHWVEDLAQETLIEDVALAGAVRRRPLPVFYVAVRDIAASVP